MRQHRNEILKVLLVHLVGGSVAVILVSKINSGYEDLAVSECTLVFFGLLGRRSTFKMTSSCVCFLIHWHHLPPFLLSPVLLDSIWESGLNWNCIWIHIEHASSLWTCLCRKSFQLSDVLDQNLWEKTVDKNRFRDFLLSGASLVISTEHNKRNIVLHLSQLTFPWKIPSIAWIYVIFIKLLIDIQIMI